MPYKPGEEAPGTNPAKIDEESRRKIFENEEVRRQRGDPEGPRDGRHYSGASRSGASQRGAGHRGGGK